MPLLFLGRDAELEVDRRRGWLLLLPSSMLSPSFWSSSSPGRRLCVWRRPSEQLPAAVDVLVLLRRAPNVELGGMEVPQDRHQLEKFDGALRVIASVKRLKGCPERGSAIAEKAPDCRGGRDQACNLTQTCMPTPAGGAMC